MEDLVWVAKLAREGELIRVPETLYFKRSHAESAHAVWLRWEAAQKRAAWMEIGLGFLEAVLPSVPQAQDHTRLLEWLLSRMLVPRTGRWLFYEPTDEHDRNAFARDFLETAAARYGLQPCRPIRIHHRWRADPAFVGLMATTA